MSGFPKFLLFALASVAIHQSCLAEPLADATASTIAAPATEKIAAYQARFGRSRPVIAVVGENSGTVVSDYVIPYGVLTQSGLADVVSVATQPGLLKLSPLQIKPDSTVAEFDQRYPDGADYVFVPAVKKRDDPTLIAWVTAQATKGATMISICNGSLVLANAGLTRGHRATGHWSTYDERLKRYPNTQWVKNIRYVVDGKIISSAGITAAIPTSLALVEAIADTERAAQLAKKLGVADWRAQHNSDEFKFESGDYLTGFANLFLRPTDEVGVPVADGVDEIALALTAEAYSATLRSHVFVIARSEAPIKTRGGLLMLPDRVIGRGRPLDRVLPAWGAAPSTRALDQAMLDITERYGARAARFVALEGEFPWHGL
ncbi:DJ-1/PfpI family protein [Polaromonas sp. CG_9.11]|uniref:DJ-1/PfpI family protein n=1 Tax=Polaromonas sp. CG_9.11 TaxID=2787730 RepID=UPI0018CAE400|nr:DJ-1/PfpI family protein [Polaromonas sp. CG_9.11]MBG6078100.1 transcriptional regulator GlxA family with amidase domain [Polaromonas sp. CG_9.11]